jgi:4-hydroxy-tetrahydrodipicolinate synthase
MRHARLRGSIPPLITPLRAGALDLDAYARLVERQIARGSHGVLVNGTTGEPASLVIAERNALVDTALAAAAGRVPVIAATGGQSLAETLELTRHAVRAGADALLIVTPYYSKPPQRGLIEYFLEVTREHETPWLVYQIPGRTAVSVSLDSLQELRERSPQLVGMKLAANDLGFAASCRSALGADFALFVGLEELSFPMLALGAAGLMNAAANLLPDRLAALCQAVWDGELAAARALHEQLLELNQAIFYETNPIPIKYMMKRLGLLRENEHRLPLVPASAQLERRLDAVLERAGLCAAGAAA